MAATKKSTQAGTKKKRAVSNSAKTSKIAFEAQQKAAKALTLRMEGATFETIAKELGYAGKQGAHDAVMRSLRAITREPATELLQLDLERLDAMWAIPYLKAQSGDLQSLDACLKIMKRRAELLGLDSPVKVDAKVDAPQGVLVAGPVMSPEEWAKAAAKQQADLQKGA